MNKEINQNQFNIFFVQVLFNTHQDFLRLPKYTFQVGFGIHLMQFVQNLVGLFHEKIWCYEIGLS